MATAFEQATSAASAAINEKAGRTYQIVPMLRGAGYKGPTVDSSRVSIFVVGVYADGPKSIGVADRSGGEEFNRKFSTTEMWLSVETAELVQFDPRAGDRVVDFETGEAFEIISTPKHGPRTHLVLVKL